MTTARYVIRRCVSLVVIAAAFIAVMLSSFPGDQSWSTLRTGTYKESEPDFDSSSLDGCYHVYLDVGSNVGIQVRKLYEPNLYPNSVALAVFDSFFGRRRMEDHLRLICTVGFEPNPSHSARLQQLEAAYRACGWPVVLRARTAVGARDGMTEFFSDKIGGGLQIGASVVGSNSNLKTRKGLVRLVRLSDFVKNVVAARVLPRVDEAFPLPAVIMKMDIEGSEIDTIADLLLTGCFQHISHTMAEFHHGLAGTKERRAKSVGLEKALQVLANITANMPNVTFMDDETFFGSNFSLPVCSQ